MRTDYVCSVCEIVPVSFGSPYFSAEALPLKEDHKAKPNSVIGRIRGQRISLIEPHVETAIREYDANQDAQRILLPPRDIRAMATAINKYCW